jgi:tRNA (guanine-N7-)-methyltransferase
LRFATDIDDYAGWALARVLRSPDFRWTAGRAEDWRKPWAGWPGTRYEAKALREGRTPSYLTFARV